MSALHIVLYKNHSAFNRLDKVLTDPIPFEVQIKGTLTHENPVFVLTRGDNDYFVGYNFLYCQELDAYYNARITVLQGGLAQISCNIDPSSFKGQIRGLNAFVERQEYVNNPYINDGLLPVAQGSIIDTIDVGAVGNATSTMYLTCIGGIESANE